MGTELTGCYPSNFCTSNAHDCSSSADCIYLGPGKYRCEVSGRSGSRISERGFKVTKWGVVFI